MTAVGLPDLADDLGVGRGTAAVLVTTYLVAMLLCQPIGGRLGDRLGNRRVLAIAIVGFTAASLTGGLAPTFAALLVARSAQALFGAALIPNAQALLRATVPPERRGRTFGLVGTGIGAGAAIGPVLGGYLADGVGWRGIFVVNVPLGALALVLLPGRRRRQPLRTPRTRPRPPARRSPGSGCSRPRPSGRPASPRRRATSPFAPCSSWRRPGATGPRTAALLVAGPLVMGFGLGLSGASLQAAAMDSVTQAVAGSAAGLYSASRYVGSIAGSLATGVTGAANARPVLVATVVAAVLATAFGSRSAPEAVD